MKKWEEYCVEREGGRLASSPSLVPEQLQASVALVLVYVISTFLSWKRELSWYSALEQLGGLTSPYLQGAEDSICHSCTV